MEKIQLVGGPTTWPSCLIPLFLNGTLTLGSLCSNNGNGTATVTQTLLENEHLGNGDNLAIIVSSSHPLSLTEHAANGLLEALHVEVNVENERFTVVCCS